LSEDPAFYVTLNLSSHQLDDTLVDRLEDTFRRYPKARDRIVLEITETALLQRGDRVAQLLEAVRGTGVRIALDDFGTGYSSLSHVHEFPVDILKVDKSFVRGLGTREADATRRQMAMITATSSLAQELGIAVVAEGIEAAITSRILQESGIRLGQGYLFSPPMPPMAFKDWYLCYAHQGSLASRRHASTDLRVELVEDGVRAAGAGALARRA
jgi:EAL domain-containing protein (putative c-di-GMP-specific phosphodiesterase class I)